jgi:hypothetical protein
LQTNTSAIARSHPLLIWWPDCGDITLPIRGLPIGFVRLLRAASMARLRNSQSR